MFSFDNLMIQIIYGLWKVDFYKDIYFKHSLKIRNQMLLDI